MNPEIWKDHIPSPSRIKPTNTSIFVQNYNMSYVLDTFLTAVVKQLQKQLKEGRVGAQSLRVRPSSQRRHGHKRVC